MCIISFLLLAWYTTTTTPTTGGSACHLVRHPDDNNVVWQKEEQERGYEKNKPAECDAHVNNFAKIFLLVQRVRRRQKPKEIHSTAGCYSLVQFSDSDEDAMVRWRANNQ